MPEGTWYDFFTKRLFNISKSGVYEYPQEHGYYIYALVRGGRIVPMREKVRMSAMLARNESYVLNVYMDAHEKAKGELYLDDGESFSYEKNQDYQIVSMKYNDNRLSGKLDGKGVYHTDHALTSVIQLIGLSAETL